TRSRFFLPPRTTWTGASLGRPAVIDVHECPPSWVTNAYGARSSERWPSIDKYAVPRSSGEASIELTERPAGTPYRLPVRTCQVWPASGDVHTLPSSVPAHSTPAFTGDSASATIVQCCSAPEPPVAIFFGSSVVRSGLTRSQRSPWSYRRNTDWPPIHSTDGSCGERRNGVFQLKRKTCSPSLFEGLIARSRPFERSWRIRSPPCDS